MHSFDWLTGDRVQLRHLDIKSRQAFTLVETLVSLAVLSLILLAVSQMVNDTGKIYKNTTGKINSFQGVRAGFQLMTSELAQATVKTYLDYFDAQGETLAQYTVNYDASGGGGNTGNNLYMPVTYGRQSELHFISGASTDLIPAGTIASGVTKTHAVFFQCPQGVNQTSGLLGLNKLLNSEGFFIEFGAQNNSANSPPAILATPDLYRYRLMQFVQTTEDFSVYDYPIVPNVAPTDWFVQPVKSNHNTTVRIVADNVIALILWPKATDAVKDTLTADTYSYDSRNGGAAGQVTTYGSTPTAWHPGSKGSTPQPLQMNQMPPLIQVAMVALDEASAAMLQGSSTTEPEEIKNALTSSGNPDHAGQIFTDPYYMDSDLNYLQSELSNLPSGKKIRFQVYSTTVAVRSAKFSTN